MAGETLTKRVEVHPTLLIRHVDALLASERRQSHFGLRATLIRLLRTLRDAGSRFRLPGRPDSPSGVGDYWLDEA